MGTLAGDSGTGSHRSRVASGAGARLDRHGWTALAFLLYAALGLLQTLPLLFRVGRVVPHDLGDPLLNTWIMWWNAHHLPFTTGWWNAGMFYPQAGAFALSEHLAGLAPLTSPLQWLGASPIAAYTVALILSFPLSAMAAHLFGLRLTGRQDAALVAGLAFGFSPYRAANLAHLQVLSSFWMPVALLALHAYLSDRRRGWLVLFGAAWLLQALTNGYYLFYFSVLVALWIFWFVRPRDWRAGAAIAAAWAVPAAALAPVLLEYHRQQAHLGLARQITEIQAFSADFTSFVHASPLLAVWRHVLSPGRSEADLFPGLAVVLLVACAVAAARPRMSAPLRPAWRRLRVAAGAAALAGLAVATSAAIYGPWSLRVAGVSLSVSRLHKPMTFAAVGLVTVFLLGARFRTAWARRSTFSFYVLATAALWVSGVGPMPRWGNVEVLYRGPYYWLMMLPGFDGLRVPARFAMPATLALAAAAGLAFARLVPVRARADQPVRRPAVSANPAARPRLLMAVLVAAAVFADGWMTHVPAHLLPAPAPSLAAQAARPAAWLEIPIGVTDWDTAALYRSMSHGVPLVNGYSGYEPPHYAPLAAGIRLHDPAVLDLLAEHGPLAVSVEREFDPDGTTRRFLLSRTGARLVSEGPRHDLFLLPAVAAVRPQGAGTPLPLAGLEASVDQAGASWMIDGDLRSRWMATSRQAGTDRIVADLGQVRDVGGVSLAQGPFFTGFPRWLRIELSADGVEWQDRWHGWTMSRFVRAGLEAPTEARAVFGFPPAPARYVRLTDGESDTASPWVVAELAVLAPAR